LLSGNGDPVAGQLVTVGTSFVDTPALGMLIAGVSTGFTPFHDGVLVPTATLALPIAANTSFTQAWPAGIPAGTPLYLQAWFKSLLTGEVSATNALVTLAQ
jgi:hypothetical protein